jgi:hypothetical protein
LKHRLEISKEYLIENYSNLKKSIPQIAKDLGCDSSTIWKRLKEYKIEKYKDRAINLTKDFLYYEYVELNKSIAQIAKENDISLTWVQKKKQEFEIKRPSSRTNVNQLQGRFFGDLEVLCISKESIQKKGRNLKWDCLCKCGNVTCISSNHLLYGYYNSCGCNNKSLIGNKSVKWCGYEEITGANWRGIVKGAVDRAIEFNITIEFAWKLFLKQDRKCTYTNQLLFFGDTLLEDRLGSTTASLDRIDSDRGYHEDNVQWVHKDINIMKRHHSSEYFIQLCKMVVENENNNSRKSE